MPSVSYTIISGTLSSQIAEIASCSFSLIATPPLVVIEVIGKLPASKLRGFWNPLRVTLCFGQTLVNETFGERLALCIGTQRQGHGG